MNREEAVVLIERLFTSYNRRPDEAQLGEWVKAQLRYKYRSDDVNAAINNLQDNSAKMPTIAELRTAVMAVQTERMRQSNTMPSTPKWLGGINDDDNLPRHHDAEYWNNLFGVANGDMARRHIGNACKRGKAQISLTIGRFINQMVKDEVPIEQRYEQLQGITTGMKTVTTKPARVASFTFEEF